MAPSAVDADNAITQEKWVYTTTTDEQIHRAIKRMKPWKAKQSDSIPNAVFIHARTLLVPYLGTIFRATDTLKIYPDDWKLTETPILKNQENLITHPQELGGP